MLTAKPFVTAQVNRHLCPAFESSESLCACHRQATYFNSLCGAPPLRYPQPHRHPAFKNVPIFERFHLANLQVSTAEPTEKSGHFQWAVVKSGGSGVRGEVVLRAANQNGSLASGKRSIISTFARNASPRTTSLVTFLFGNKKVTPVISSTN